MSDSVERSAQSDSNQADKKGRLPCLCGNRLLVDMESKGIYWVQCGVCGKFGPDADSLEKAHLAWNQHVSTRCSTKNL